MYYSWDGYKRNSLNGVAVDSNLESLELLNCIYAKKYPIHNSTPVFITWLQSPEKSSHLNAFSKCQYASSARHHQTLMNMLEELKLSSLLMLVS